MVKKRSSRLSLKKSSLEIHQLAHYAFFIGLLVAILAGILRSVIQFKPETLISILVILGTVVGIFNLTTKETIPFLVASIALMLAGIVNLGLIPGVGLILRSVLSNIVVFVVPGAIIVGFKTIWKLASD